MGPTGGHEMLVTNMFCSIPEDQRPQVHCGSSLQSHIILGW